MWQTGQTPIPGYTLEKFLGRGNFGEVWQATSPGGTKCALKFLNLRERQGRKELRAIQRLKHIRHANLMPFNAMWLLDEQQRLIPDDQLDSPNSFMDDTRRQTLVATPQVSEEDKPKTLVIAMPVAEGNLLELLHQRQAAGQEIPVEELLVYIMDAARALDYLNSQRHEYAGELIAVQHGDVKPENLVLLGGSVMLCDFGVARTLGSGSAARGTSLGGSLAYMAPECLAGESSPHSDQFSLALSYVELRTGRLPFEEDSISQIIEDRRTGQLKLDGLSAAEERVIRRACSVNPSKRFSSNVALVDALRSAVLATAPTAKRYGWLKLTAVVVGCLALGIALWAIYERPSPPAPPVARVPAAKTGKQYFSEAMSLLQRPNVLPMQLAEATTLYLSALANEFPAEVPAPRRMGFQDDTIREQVYPPIHRRRLGQLVAVHPETLRVLVLGGDGRSLVEPASDLHDTLVPLELEVPIASVHWLDESQLLIIDLQTNLWRLSLEPLHLEQITTAVLQVASSPLKGIAISASDDDGTGESSLLMLRDGKSERISLPAARSQIISPLLSIDPAGVWGTVFEEIEKSGTGSLIRLDAAGAPATALVESEIEPYCCTCLRIGSECLVIVGGKAPAHDSGLAVVQLSTDDNSANVNYPQAAASQSLFAASDRFVRTLATHVDADQRTALLAAGQDTSTDTPATELWQIQPDGAASFQGLVGQATQGPSISALAFDASGQWLARGTSYGEVRLTKLSNPQVDFELMSQDYLEEVIQIQFVDGQLMVAFADATVLIWNFYECQMVYEAHVSQDRPLPSIVPARPQAG